MSISIVIPSYNGRHLLAKNLPKVIEAVGNSEIVVVDDGSGDGTVSFLRKNFPQIKVVKHQQNKRFAAACNSGVEKAQGEIIILLNNDVIPQKDFLKPLTRHFKNRNVFSVGCKEVEQKDGQTVEAGRNKAKFKRGFLVHWRAKNQNKKRTFWTFGGSMAVSREKYLQLGGMDEIYKPAYWEDIDLCYRARKKGWTILFEPKSIVYHQHETTNRKELGKGKMAAAAYKNQILFVWKNIRGWRLINHFCWLPYHLLLTTIKSKGLFLIGFFWAGLQAKALLKRIVRKN